MLPLSPSVLATGFGTDWVQGMQGAPEKVAQFFWKADLQMSLVEWSLWALRMTHDQSRGEDLTSSGDRPVISNPCLAQLGSECLVGPATFAF